MISTTDGAEVPDGKLVGDSDAPGVTTALMTDVLPPLCCDPRGA